MARQFAGGKHVLIVRNGWFSYRWTQIFEMAGVAHESAVEAMRLASHKLPVAPRVVVRETAMEAGDGAR